MATQSDCDFYQILGSICLIMNFYEKQISQLSDTDVETALNDLTKKYFICQRLGKYDQLTQLSNYITLYKEEMQSRHRKNLKLDNDLNTLINIE
jgi:hypothetical protein